MLFKTILVTVLIVLLPSSALPQPVVQAAEGLWENGNTITLRGQEFGQKVPAAPILWDAVDNQSAYSGLSHGDVIPTNDHMPGEDIYPWRANGEWGYQEQVEYWTTGTRGVRSAHYHVDSLSSYLMGPYDYGAETDGSHFYVNWWMRLNEDPSDGGSVKFIRVWSDITGSGRISFLHDYLVTSVLGGVDGDSIYYEADWPNWGGDFGETWHNCEIVINSDSAGVGQSDGTVLIKTDGVVCHDVQYLGTVLPLNQIRQIGLAANQGQNLSDEFVHEFGEIYIDSTFARAFVADAATYANVTHSEIQIPQTWAADEITIEVNQGSFPNGQQAYVYVVDETGAVNEQGFSIVFGGEVDNTPPAAVTTLDVESTTQTTATLTWTAVGDDGNTGTATSYDLRYSTSVITEGNWNSATQATGEPDPQAAGETETFTVTGLNAGTMYYFALKVADEVPNWSGLSNVASGATQPSPDTTPPATIDDLRV